MGALVLFGMVFLALVINPGGGILQPAVARRTSWYAGFAKSDKPWLATAARFIAKGHLLARTAWVRTSATAIWLLGR